MNKRFINSVDATSVYRSANIGSHHYLVSTTIKFRLSISTETKQKSQVRHIKIALVQFSVCQILPIRSDSYSN